LTTNSVIWTTAPRLLSKSIISSLQIFQFLAAALTTNYEIRKLIEELSLVATPISTDISCTVHAAGNLANNRSPSIQVDLKAGRSVAEALDSQ
jgi:hypothetical protein